MQTQCYWVTGKALQIGARVRRGVMTSGGELEIEEGEEDDFGFENHQGILRDNADGIDCIA